MMNKSKIEKRLPEPQPNREQKADGLPSSQTIAKPLVSGSLSDEEIYQWAINKAKGFEREQLARQCFFEGAIWMKRLKNK